MGGAAGKGKMNDNSEGAVFAPEVVVLYCGNCVSPDANITAESSRTKGFSVRTKMLPCSSKVEVSYLLKILQKRIFLPFVEKVESVIQ